MKNLKYLLVHTGWSERAIKWHQDIAEEHKKDGYHVTPFCVISEAPGKRYNFKKLDELWKKRDKGVVKIYNQLKELTKDHDVLINYNGSNIHPAWLKEFNTFNIYVCFDDPESSEVLSEPVAKYFDFAFTGNAACVQLYQSWGIKNCDFLPICCHPQEYDHSMSVERILKEPRENDVIFLGERKSVWRKDRLDRIQEAFPKAILRGEGWPKGRLPDQEKIARYINSKIGINIHNSVGPVNLRTYALPANGLLQVADNKHRLGSVFKVGEEVVGFDTIEEGIDLTKFYLAHEKERREIAARGFERVMKDYTLREQWQIILNTLQPFYQDGKLKTDQTVQYETASEPSTITQVSKNIIKETLRKVGVDVKRIEKDSPPIEKLSTLLPYIENPEAGPINFEDKINREKAGGFFEWPNIVALNWAVATLVGDAKKIVDVGCGTGAFAYEVAKDPTVSVLAADLNSSAIEWAKTHRQSDNIVYENRMITEDDGPFDLAVSIEVVEHINDYRAFITTLTKLAKKLIITTPNKSRTQNNFSGPPAYYQHTREWTAGELYWILKIFYKEVKLYSMPNQYLPAVCSITVGESLTPLIAVCEHPIE